MEQAHPLENQKLASIPAEGVDTALKPEDRPTTQLVIEMVPGENGAYKVSSQAQGGVALSDKELALVQAFRDQEAAAEKAATQAQADEAAKTVVPAASLSDAEKTELDDFNAFQAWKANREAPVEQTGAASADAGSEEYKVPGGAQ